MTGATAVAPLVYLRVSTAGGAARRSCIPMSSSNSSYLFTSESVSEGHPDKVADQISDAVLDAIIAEDKRARVACETLVKTGCVIVAGEITTKAWVDSRGAGAPDGAAHRLQPQRDGLRRRELRGDQHHRQAVAGHRPGRRPQGPRASRAPATRARCSATPGNETDVLMPAPITLRHRLVKRQAEVRPGRKLPWLRRTPRARSPSATSTTARWGIEAVVLSTQHAP